MSQIGFLAPSLETVKGYFERFGVAGNVNFVPGYFEETMAELSGRRWSLVRLDADTYRATRVTLDALYPGLANGGYLVIDDYFHPVPARVVPQGSRRFPRRAFDRRAGGADRLERRPVAQANRARAGGGARRAEPRSAATAAGA